MTLKDEIIYRKNEGGMKKNLVLVESHVSGIIEDLQAIDSALFIMYNPSTNKCEVHRRGVSMTYEMGIPYEQLDRRVIYAYLNGLDIKKVEKEIEENNAKVELDAKKKTEHETSCRLRDTFDYVNRHSDKEVLGADAYSTRFI